MAAPRGPAFAARPMGGPAVVARPVGVRPVGARTFVNPGHVFFTTRFPGRFHHRFFFSDCFTFPCDNRFFFGTGFGFGWPWGWGGWGWGYPYGGYPYSYPPDYSAQAAPAQTVASDNTNTQFAVAMQRLTDEVQDLKDDLNRQASAARPPLPAGSSSAQQPAAATTFVFRDGHRVITQNYAIAGQTLWILSEHAAKKISLADLNLTATEQVNAANGVDVHIPEPH